jgi:hypothetical protein
VKAGVVTFPEVTNISRHGIWLLTSHAEHFLPFEQFPWFAKASIEQIVNVVEPFPGQYHWPDLDVDLSESILSAPDDYPLVSKS